ncbi:MAG: hypothetical protein KBG84_16355 [Planctomycetes bacterium]|nr:hypothetical protein [Planctomycetota bacterium]
MAKAPQQSNTQLGISEQTAREFKRIAEQEEKAGTESWNDGEYDSAADHFERAANTLRKYAAHVQAPAQAQVIKRKAAKLLDLCNQLRALTVDGQPDESKANRLRTESQSELAVINADIEAATPHDSGDSSKRKPPDNSSAVMEMSVNVPKPPEADKPKAADLPPRTESAASKLDAETASQPHLRLVAAAEAKPAEKPRSEVLHLEFGDAGPEPSAPPPAPSSAPDFSEAKTAPSLRRIEEGVFKAERVVQLGQALSKCDFFLLASAFDAIADDYSEGKSLDPQREIELMLSSVFAREAAGVLRKAPDSQNDGALQMARKAYAEGNFKGAAEQFKRAAMELLASAGEGKSDDEVSANELKASKLLTFSSRLRKTSTDGKGAT